MSKNIERCKFFNPKPEEKQERRGEKREHQRNERDKMKICDNFGLFNCSINCGDNSCYSLSSRLLSLARSLLGGILFTRIRLLGFSIHFYYLRGFCLSLLLSLHEHLSVCATCLRPPISSESASLIDGTDSHKKDVQSDDLVLCCWLVMMMSCAEATFIFKTYLLKLKD
jgi:hypothetical protein